MLKPPTAMVFSWEPVTITDKSEGLGDTTIIMPSES
jgi:hypothetical protein